NVNSISLARGEEERNDDNDVATGDDIEKPTKTEMGMPVKEAEKENEAENGIKNKPIRKAKKEEMTKAPSSQPVEYYLKHKINEKLIEGLVDNHRLSSIHVPQAYAEEVYSNPHPRNQNEPPKQSPFTFRECIGRIPQP
nr:hypothetical protein [Tanacetum cinerariifolium]